MKVTFEDLIENISGFENDHVYALLGASLEPGKLSPQSGLVLVKRGKAFFRIFKTKFKAAICEQGGLRDQVNKVAKTDKDIPSVLANLIFVKSAEILGTPVAQIVAVYLAVLLTKITLDTYCHGYKQHK